MYKFYVGQEVILDEQEATILEQVENSEDANYYKLQTKEGIKYEYEAAIKFNFK
jgi:hypothetical protein